MTQDDKKYETVERIQLYCIRYHYLLVTLNTTKSKGVAGRDGITRERRENTQK